MSVCPETRLLFQLPHFSLSPD